MREELDPIKLKNLNTKSKTSTKFKIQNSKQLKTIQRRKAVNYIQGSKQLYSETYRFMIISLRFRTFEHLELFRILSLGFRI